MICTLKSSCFTITNICERTRSFVVKMCVVACSVSCLACCCLEVVRRCLQCRIHYHEECRIFSCAMWAKNSILEYKSGAARSSAFGCGYEPGTLPQCTLHCCEASLQHIDREQWQKQQFKAVVPGALRRAEDCAGSLLEWLLHCYMWLSAQAAYTFFFSFCFIVICISRLYVLQ